MANFPGPYEVRFFYTTNEPIQISSHVTRLSLLLVGTPQPGDTFDTIQTQNKIGNPVLSLKQAVDAFVIIMRSFFAPPVDIERAELWRYVQSSFDAVFVSAYTIGLQGNSGSQTQTASQTIVSFRTRIGGIMKVDFRGTVFAPAQAQSFPTSSTLVNTLAAHMVQTDTPWIGRDNSYPLAPIRFLPGQNERAWKRVFR